MSESDRARRRAWAGGLVESGQSKDADRAFWRKATTEERLTAACEMLEHYAITHGHGPQPRLQRHLGGVRPTQS